MMSIRVIFLFSLLTLLTFSLIEGQTIPVPYSHCGTATDLFKISNVTSNEWPPKKGTDLTVLFDGTVLENVTDGHYEITVTWETLPVYDEKGDITALLLNQSLPIINGTFCYLEKNVTLSSDIPSGSYVVKVQAWDVNNKVFTCFTASFHLNETPNQQSQLQPIGVPTPTKSATPVNNLKVEGRSNGVEKFLHRQRKG